MISSYMCFMVTYFISVIAYCASLWRNFRVSTVKNFRKAERIFLAAHFISMIA